MNNCNKKDLFVILINIVNYGVLLKTGLASFFNMVNTIRYDQHFKHLAAGNF